MAYFHKGLVYECNVLGPLTIEGRRIRVKGTKRPDALRRLAEDLIDNSPEYAALRKRQAEDVALLDRYLRRDDRGRSWNAWRRKNPAFRPFLAAARLDGEDLSGFDLSYANLTQAKMRKCILKRTNFHHAILSNADLQDADLTEANMCATDLYLTQARGASFVRTNLQGVHLVGTELTGATLTDCTVYGLSAWDLNSTPATQEGFRIKFARLSPTRRDPGRLVEDEVVVDDLEMAHFTYSALHNSNIRKAFTAAGSKTVLLLGRFSDPRRKSVLERLRVALREEHYIPMIFDFERPKERDLTETIQLLAGLSLFVIADVTDPRSTPQELEAIAPRFQIPIVPIVQEPARVFSTFEGLMKYSWVLTPLEYDTVANLIRVFRPAILAPALAMSRTRIEARQREVKARHVRQFLRHRP